MKGETHVINGDRWTVVDVAPAAPLAEMVAALLEEAGFLVLVRGLGRVGDAFSHLGAESAGTTLVLVPEPEAGRALALIEETVTDYQGEELEQLLEAMAGASSLEELEALGVDLDEWAASDDEEERG